MIRLCDCIRDCENSYACDRSQACFLCHGSVERNMASGNVEFTLKDAIQCETNSTECSIETGHHTFEGENDLMRHSYHLSITHDRHRELTDFLVLGYYTPNSPLVWG